MSPGRRLPPHGAGGERLGACGRGRSRDAHLPGRPL